MEFRSVHMVRLAALVDVDPDLQFCSKTCLLPVMIVSQPGGSQNALRYSPLSLKMAELAWWEQ